MRRATRLRLMACDEFEKVLKPRPPSEVRLARLRAFFALLVCAAPWLLAACFLIATQEYGPAVVADCRRLRAQYSTCTRALRPCALRASLCGRVLRTAEPLAACFFKLIATQEYGRRLSQIAGGYALSTTHAPALFGPCAPRARYAAAPFVPLSRSQPAS